jgi:ribosomal protein S18 acetylase RimI-like enzyme
MNEYFDKMQYFLTIESVKELFSSVGWNVTDDIEKFLNAIKKSSHCAIAYDNNKLVGFIRSMDDGYWQANIDCLLVHKDYQKKGIGTKLMNDLLYDLKDIKYINVCPNDKNMKKFYQKFGFKSIGGIFLQKENS